ADEPVRRSQQRCRAGPDRVGARRKGDCAGQGCGDAASLRPPLTTHARAPHISDPGHKLVRAARAAGHTVHTVPGPSALVAALTLAGLPTDRFLFLGFLPAKAKARADAIAEIADVRATLVLYESGARLGDALAALAAGLG